MGAIALVALLAGGGSSPSKQGARKGAARTPSSAADINVVVLNATEVTGLAHRLAASLRAKGYAKANPRDGQPSGSYPSTVVEYSPGYVGAARRVASALSRQGAQVRSLEPSAESLASGAPVVVVAGANEASAQAQPGESVP